MQTTDTRQSTDRSGIKDISRVDQWCLDRLLGMSGSGKSIRLSRRLLRSYLSTRPVDKRHLVRYELAGRQLLLPSSHPLPYYQQVHPKYQLNVGVAAKAISEKYPRSTIIDIGANVGDSAAIMRKQCAAPILCIEGDPIFFEILQANAAEWTDLELVHAFVSATGDSDRSYEAQSDRGTGRLVAAATSLNVTPTVRLDSILGNQPDFSSHCKLVKLDTDGLDTLLLRGCREFLARNEPAIFFEYDPSLFLEHDPQGEQVFQYLAQLDYGPAVVYDNFGYLIAVVEFVDSETMRDLARYLTTRKIPYYDLLVFPRLDQELAGRVRELELATYCSTGNA